jgi:hypothetical protein
VLHLGQYMHSSLVRTLAFVKEESCEVRIRVEHVGSDCAGIS